MEKPRMISAPVMLKGLNYLLWSRTMKITLCSHGLWSHVTTKKLPLLVDDGDEVAEEAQEGLDKWFQEDQLVFSILQNSLESSLLEAYSYCDSAKDLWDTLEKVYGNSSNLLRIYEVKKALYENKQHELDFTKHFGQYRALWAELEMLRPRSMDPATINERLEQDKVFGLFMTLNSTYTDLIKHMLREDKLPSLEDVCARIQREQGSHVLFGSKDELAIAHRGSYKAEDKKKMVCDHCKGKGHSRKDCWVLHPNLKPYWFVSKSHKEDKAHGFSEKTKAVSEACSSHAHADPSNDFVTKADLQALIQALNKGNVIGKSLHASFQTYSNPKPLIVDSGASHHMISDLELIENLQPTLGNVLIANGTKVPIKGIGKLKLFDKESKAFYMPSFTSNLLSVKRATTDLNCQAIFGPNEFYFQDIETNAILGKGTTKEDLYVLENLSLDPSLKTHVASKCGSDRADLWHARLGHPHARALELLLPRMKFKNELCEACILGKHCRTVFQKSLTSYDNCFELVHSDVWTSPYPSREHHKYFVTFIDEKSKYTWVTLLTSKDRVLEAFINFQTYVANHYNAKIKCLRSDNGGEYTSNKFANHLKAHGIIHQTSCPYTPQQNGVAERKNRHLMEVVRSMMFHMKVPKMFWGDALVAACYLINRTPTQVLDDLSPFEVLNKTKPNVDHLRVFGCVCFVLVPSERRNKLEPRSIKAIFIGYSPTQKGYKCYDPQTRKVMVSRDVKFFETNRYFDEGTWDQFKDISSSATNQAENLRRILESFGITTSLNKPPTQPSSSPPSAPPPPTATAPAPRLLQPSPTCSTPPQQPPLDHEGGGWYIYFS